MAFSWNNDNAAAAGNSQRALGDLGQFIYQQQVLKPQVQATTAETKARTGNIQQLTAAQVMQNKVAQLGLAQLGLLPQGIGSGVDYNKAANDAVQAPTATLGGQGATQPPQSTDITPTTPPMVGNPNNAANGGPAGVSPAGYSEASTMTSGSPTPNISTIPGAPPGARKSFNAGSTAGGDSTYPGFQGTGADSGLKDMVPGPNVKADDADRILTQAGTLPASNRRDYLLSMGFIPNTSAATGNSIARPNQSADLSSTGATMGVPSAASRNGNPLVNPHIGQPPGTLSGTLPALSPADVLSNPTIGQPGVSTPPDQSWTADRLSHSFLQEMPPGARASVLSQLRANANKMGLNLSDEALEHIHTSNLLQTRIPPQFQQGAVWDTFGPEGVKGHFPHGNESGTEVDPTGVVSGLPAQVRGINGEPIANPFLIPPEKIQEARDNLGALRQTRQVLDKTQSILDKYPDLFGPATLGHPLSGGGFNGLHARSLAARGGSKEALAKSSADREIQQFLANQKMDLLGHLHLGRITQLEYDQLSTDIPSQNSPVEVWKNYIAQEQDYIQQHDRNTAALIKGQKLSVEPYSATPKQNLPNVNLSGVSVTAPPGGGVGSQPSKLSSWDDVKGLSPGTVYIGPDGISYTRGKK